VVGTTEGRFAVARLAPDGRPVSQVATEFPDGVAGAQGVAVQPDGKAVVVGTAAPHNGDFAVARYNADGTLDDSFGGGPLIVVAPASRAVMPARLHDAAMGFSHSHEYYVALVTRAYRQLLKREPDAGGLGSWVAGLEAGRVTDESLEAGFVSSREYLDGHGG